MDNVILTPHIGGSTQEAQVDIGRYVAGKLIDYVDNGATGMSVNIPEITPSPRTGARIGHLHRNVPGVMATLNRLVADQGGKRHLPGSGDEGRARLLHSRHCGD